MTHAMEVPFKALAIVEESEHACTMCSKVDELRPYGPNGSEVCFNCMMKDEPLAVKIFTKRMEDANGYPNMSQLQD